MFVTQLRTFNNIVREKNKNSLVQNKMINGTKTKNYETYNNEQKEKVFASYRQFQIKRFS